MEISDVGLSVVVRMPLDQRKGHDSFLLKKDLWRAPQVVLLVHGGRHVVCVAGATPL
ncbi:hypothetical protein A2U01_0107480, partial [Trifolium medium]|nr:hypothetical protein [Trifolium medium]